MTIDINNLGNNRSEGLRRSSGDKTVKQESAGTASSKTSSESASQPSTSVSLSSAARNLAQIESELKGLPEIDQQRVDAIRTMLSEGKYQMDFQRLAQKMLDMES